ncbi:Gfo/Idh/MocA family protein [Saccharibacillus kuerlensis]|uniref:Dehydrogenase n=1 Tax=Saccharibacillus kuerlensis TaxID=459527 RepID=A0ABQ2L416_9BACL|nr:Gfo/Idh/MocA family oxidoreductase [Saccharibacillus kuerlensis]GGO01500.1 dehydrogenase [Saccharibacillus kuerlensis]
MNGSKIEKKDEESELKAAIVGCGTMGRMHAQAYVRLKGVRLAAVCDVSQEASSAFAEQFRCSRYGSLREMLLAEKPDVLSVCLPTPLHSPAVRTAAELGVHVICEKPLAGNLQEAEEMIAFCRKRDVRLFVGQVVRFFPSYRNLTETVRSGAIGAVGVAHTKRIGPHPAAAKPWYGQDELSGGVILDLLVHDIDYMRGLLGDPHTVFAMRRVNKGIDYALVTLTFENGSMANLEGMWGYPGPFSTSVELGGSGGVALLDSSASRSVEIRRMPGTMNVDKSDIAAKEAAAKNQAAKEHAANAVALPELPAYDDPYGLELEHFLSCIRSGETPLVTAEDAAAAVKIAEAALHSARSGRPIDLRRWQAQAPAKKEGLECES